MKPAFKILFAMASDRRIDDRSFRKAVLELSKCSDTNAPMDEYLRVLAQDAIYATERKYVK